MLTASELWTAAGFTQREISGLVHVGYSNIAIAATVYYKNGNSNNPKTL